MLALKEAAAVALETVPGWPLVLSVPTRPPRMLFFAAVGCGVVVTGGGVALAAAGASVGCFLGAAVGVGEGRLVDNGGGSVVGAGVGGGATGSVFIVGVVVGVGGPLARANVKQVASGSTTQVESVSMETRGTV